MGWSIGRAFRGVKTSELHGPFLFQFHEQQHKDRPNSYGHRELHHRGIPHRASSGQRKRQQHHCESGEHSYQESAFQIH
jgi:hypothetical protein